MTVRYETMNNRIWLLIFSTVVAAFLLGCSATRNNASKNECETFYQFFSNDWKTKKENGKLIYAFSNVKGNIKFLNKFETGILNSDLTNCFQGLGKKKIEKIIGAPSRIINNNFEYYFSIDCFNQDEYYEFLKVTFSSVSNKVERVEFTGRGEKD